MNSGDLERLSRKLATYNAQTLRQWNIETDSRFKLPAMQGLTEAHNMLRALLDVEETLTNRNLNLLQMVEREVVLRERRQVYNDTLRGFQTAFFRNNLVPEETLQSEWSALLSSLDQELESSRTKEAWTNFESTMRSLGDERFNNNERKDNRTRNRRAPNNRQAPTAASSTSSTSTSVVQSSTRRNRKRVQRHQPVDDNKMRDDQVSPAERRTRRRKNYVPRRRSQQRLN